MAFIPSPATAVRTVLDGTLRGQQVINVMHYLFDSVPDLGDLDDLNDAIHDSITPDTTGLFEAIGPQYTLQRITSTRVNAVGGLQSTRNSGEVGKANTDALNNMQALVVTLRTAQAGRSFRGRTFLAGVSEGNLAADPNYLDLTGNFIGTAFEAGFITQPAGISNPAILCVASFFSGVDANGDPIPRALGVYTPVSQVTVNTRLDTQRRRRPPA